MFALRTFAVVVGVLLFGAALASGQTTSSQPADRLICGDWTVDVGINAVELTAEQKEKLKPMFEGFAKDIKDAKSAYEDKLKQVQDKIKAKRDDAAKNGTVKDLEGQDDYKALVEQQNTMQAQEKKDTAARHDRINDDIWKVLTPSQKRKFMMKAGLASQDPKRMRLSRAMIIIEGWAPGIEFTDRKFDALTEKIVEMIEKHEATVAEAKETDPLKVREWWMSTDKKMREAIDEAMTDEQKKQAAANRHDRLQKVSVSVTDAVVKSINPLDPTAEQKEKAAALAAAARERMLKLESEDQDAWHKIYVQLREDVDRLLTPEQKAKRDTPVPIN